MVGCACVWLPQGPRAHEEMVGLSSSQIKKGYHYTVFIQIKIRICIIEDLWYNIESWQFKIDGYFINLPLKFCDRLQCKWTVSNIPEWIVWNFSKLHSPEVGGADGWSATRVSQLCSLYSSGLPLFSFWISRSAVVRTVQIQSSCASAWHAFVILVTHERQEESKKIYLY